MGYWTYRIRTKWLGDFAHWLVRVSERIMPKGHCKGVFRRDDIAETLAAYGSALSWARADLFQANLKISAVEAVREEMRAAHQYEFADKLRAALATDSLLDALEDKDT